MKLTEHHTGSVLFVRLYTDSYIYIRLSIVLLGDSIYYHSNMYWLWT